MVIIDSRFMSIVNVFPVKNPPDHPSGSVPIVRSIRRGTLPKLWSKIFEFPSRPSAIENPSSLWTSRVVISLTSNTVALVTIVSPNVTLTVIVFLSPFSAARGTMVRTISLDSAPGSTFNSAFVSSPEGGSSSKRYTCIGQVLLEERARIWKSSGMFPRLDIDNIVVTVSPFRTALESEIATGPKSIPLESEI